MELHAKALLNKMDLFKFLVHHMYINSSGIIYTAVALLSLAGGIYYLVAGNTTGIFLILICAVYFVLMPTFLYLKAVRQSKNEVFQKETNYVFTEKNLYASQGEEEPSHVSWDTVRKVIKFQKEYIIYVSSVRANVIPLSAFSVSEKEVDSFFAKTLPKNKLKGIKI